MARFSFTLLVLLGIAAPSRAYIAAMPTLGNIIADADHICVLRVDKVSRENQRVIFSKVADLKGKDAPDVVKHQLKDGIHPRQARTVLDWAEPGAIAICFQRGNVSQACIGGYWYECAKDDDAWWTMTNGKPELSYAYSGSTARLRDHLTAMLAGREVIVTALKYRQLRLEPGGGVGRKWEDLDTVEAVGSRRLMRGKDWPVCRIKASLKMPNTIPELFTHHSELLVGDGPAAADDVPALIERLELKDASLRIEAAEDLGLIGPAAKDAVPALIKLSQNDPDRLIRLEAAKAVASIDPKNETAIPLLIEALKDKGGKIRRRGAECLGDLGPRCKSAVPELVKAVKDPDPTVSWAAIDALGQIGPDAEPAVPTLIEALKDQGTRGAAVDALGQIGAKARDAVGALEKVLQGEDVSIRWATAAALVKIGGPGLKTGVRYLLETATRDPGRDWTDAHNILMAPTSRQALPVMLDAVRDPAVRELAEYICVEMSVYLTKDPLADVKPLLEDKDAGVRCVTAWVLHTARAVDIKDVIAVQRATLKSTNPWARQQAALFLGKLGSSAKDAADDLSALLDDKDENVRKTAAEALKSIRGK